MINIFPNAILNIKNAKKHFSKFTQNLLLKLQVKSSDSLVDLLIVRCTNLSLMHLYQEALLTQPKD